VSSEAAWYQPVASAVQARQWDDRTDLTEELADWCDGWAYTGDRHGHTRPPWQHHTCITPGTQADGGKGHADPGDWIIRIAPGVYEILEPPEFQARYRRIPAPS
jgi:hypothetical protein